MSALLDNVLTGSLNCLIRQLLCLLRAFMVNQTFSPPCSRVPTVIKNKMINKYDIKKIFQDQYIPIICNISSKFMFNFNVNVNEYKTISWFVRLSSWKQFIQKEKQLASNLTDHTILPAAIKGLDCTHRLYLLTAPHSTPTLDMSKIHLNSYKK